MNLPNLPERLIRLDDGEEFILKPNGKYSSRCMLEMEKKGHLISEYDYKTLIVYNRKSFKVADGTEDLTAMRKRWLENCDNCSNSGCGDEDDGC